MSDFKIIAIRPLEGCNPKYIKVLKLGQIYTLYNDYKISDDGNKITYTKTVPDDLYDIGVGKPKINISAIVGKNGTGKSTITDLILMAINNISFVFKRLNIIKTVELEPVKELFVDMFIHLDKCYRISFDNNTITIYAFKKSGEVYSICQTEKWVACFEEIYESSYATFKTHKSLDFNLSDFFYSVCVNYSHYSLNSNEFGDWVHNVFFKNDAYQAPLVVNPFRLNGNIDINKENYLSRSRLLAYLLTPEGVGSHRNITEKQYASKVIFTLNKEKFNYVYVREWFSSEHKSEKVKFENFDVSGYTQRIIIDLIRIIYGFNTLNRSGPVIFEDEIEKYIVRKLISICRNYNSYTPFFNSETGKFRCEVIEFDGRKQEVNLKLLINAVKSDNSHVTFKLNQAINYLRYNPFGKFVNYVNYNQTISISIDDIFNEVCKCKPLGEDVINYLPPAIFDFDIELNSETYEKDIVEKPRFSSLSSGEKQRIYSVYSILYHIYNIDSVLESENLIKYSKVNLLFEEVEMYFHPEMQKGLINFLLKKLADQNYKYINGINICFVTHSPFILSDIPESNILFLDVEEGKAIPQIKPVKTFGANIHDLLRNGFFMENGLIGEYSKGIIKLLVKSLSNERFDDQVRSELYIQMMGDPIIKKHLYGLLNENNKENKSREDLLMEIRELKMKLNNEANRNK